MKLIMITFLVGHFNLYAKDTELEVCDTSKEYITIYNYLNSIKKIELKNEDKLNVSGEVSSGCNDAAKRFINVYELLTKSNVSISDAIDMGVKYSNLKNINSETFILIFKEAYLKEYLDIELRTSLNIAKEMSLNTEGDLKIIKKDFYEIASFCRNNKNISLNNLNCLEVAKKVALISKKFQMQLADSFISLYNFLVKTDEVSVTFSKGLELSLKLINYGPKVDKNFKEAFLFAINELKYSREKSIDFASEISKKSFKN